MTRHFTSRTFEFLRHLAANNDRGWFKAHQADYESWVRRPALAFIADAAGPLAEISLHLSVETAVVGGSLGRVQRDMRFATDKTPYKTHVGMHFRHVSGTEAHTPGFHVRLEPGRSYLGVGMWRPAAPLAHSVRRAIAARPEAWTEAARGDNFAEVFRLEGESLVRPPAGFDPSHRLVDDLRRRDFAAARPLTQKLVVSEDFLPTFVDDCRRATPFMRFLCDAVGLPF